MRLAVRSPHTSLQPISTGARKHLVDPENVVRVDPQPHVKVLLSDELREVLVRANPARLHRLGRQLHGQRGGEERRGGEGYKSEQADPCCCWKTRHQPRPRSSHANAGMMVRACSLGNPCRHRLPLRGRKASFRLNHRRQGFHTQRRDIEWQSPTCSISFDTRWMQRGNSITSARLDPRS